MMSSCFSPCSCSCTPCCCNSCFDITTTSTTTANPNISTTTTQFVCEDIIPIECIIYNGTFLEEYGINPGDSLLDIINLISQFLCPCTTTTTIEPCTCYKLFNPTLFDLNYTIVNCSGVESSGVLVSNQTKYVCSRASGFEYDAGLEVDVESILTCTGQTPTCVQPVSKCHAVTSTGEVVVSYINVDGIKQFITVVNATINICAWANSVIKATGTGTMTVVVGATCTQDSECLITTTSTSSTTTSTTIPPTSTTTTTTLACFCYLLHNIGNQTVTFSYDECDPQTPIANATIEVGQNLYVCSTDVTIPNPIPGELEVTAVGPCTNDCILSRSVCIQIDVIGTAELGWIDFNGFDATQTVTDDTIYVCAWSGSVYKISGTGTFTTIEGGSCTTDQECQNFTTSTTSTSTTSTSTTSTSSTTTTTTSNTSSTTTTAAPTTSTTTATAPCYGHTLNISTNSCGSNGILRIYDITTLPGTLVVEYNTDDGPHTDTTLLMPGSTYRIQGNWDSGSSNQVRFRVCNVTLGTEEFYTSTPLTASNITAYYDITVPSPLTTCYTYSVDLRSCSEIPAICGV